MKAQFGFIGKEEIEQAKEELVNQYRFDDGTWMKKNIWFEKPHTGNYVKGYDFDDIEEVLSNETEYTLDTFHDMGEVEAYTEEFDCDFSDEDITKFQKIFNEGKTAYMIDGDVVLIDDDKEYLCWGRIEDGQFNWNGTVEEAYTILNECTGCDSVNQYAELISVGVLG